jgi:hypothetical protein
VSKCLECNHNFIPHKFNIHQKYCSSKCREFHSSKKLKCIDCGKQLSRYNAKRCKSCCQKGKLNSAFTTGITLQTTCKCGNSKDYRADKCAECHYKINVGKNHGSWLGGISKLPYPFEFDNNLKESIRKRDNYTCQNPECNMTEEESIFVLGRVLDVHHIDYNKKNCNESNLISTCLSCNTRANFRREYWKRIYTNILKGVIL